jgi:branched-chain amino acid transport system ATP-binding protein
MSSTLLSVDNLSVRYGRLQALDDVSFTIPEGSVLAIVGANGAGKSSLGRALSGLVTPAAGRICVQGIDITAWPADRIRRAGVAYLPEGRGVFPTLTVIDNLRMGVRWMKSKADRQASITRSFDLFPILQNRRAQKAGTLSGGEQQMLSLARSFAVLPSLLIADELSLGLAPMMVDVVFEQLEWVHHQKATIIVIEQFIHRALQFADDLMILNRGSIVWQGPTGSISHQEIVDRYMGEAANERK